MATRTMPSTTDETMPAMPKARRLAISRGPMLQAPGRYVAGRGFEVLDLHGGISARHRDRRQVVNVCRLADMMLQIPIRRVATLVLVAADGGHCWCPALVLAHAELETRDAGRQVDRHRARRRGVRHLQRGDDARRQQPRRQGRRRRDGRRGHGRPEDDTADGRDAGRRRSATAPTRSNPRRSATDGHTERATWTFTVAVAPTPSPTPVATAAPSAAATPPPTPGRRRLPLPSAAPTPVPSADGGATGSGGDVLLPIIVALIILGAGAAYLLSRRNRPPDART